MRVISKQSKDRAKKAVTATQDAFGVKPSMQSNTETILDELIEGVPDEDAVLKALKPKGKKNASR